MMSESVIKTGEYMGHVYGIRVATGAGWGDHLGMFFVNSAFTTDYYATAAEAERAITAEIDAWNLGVPESDGEWVNEVEACLVWDGYEECHIDEAKIMSVLKMYKDKGGHNA